MKQAKIKLASIFMATAMVFGAFGQDDMSDAAKPEKTGPADGYNKAYLDINVGFNKPFSPFSAGTDGQIIGLFHADLGFRYMPNPKFGVRATLRHESFKNASSLSEFSTIHESITFEGILNFGAICNFEEWTKVLGLHLHAGPGIAYMSGTTTAGNRGRDLMGHIQFGVTPRFKLNEKLAINTDLTFVGNMLQGRTFDFKSNNPYGNGFNGYMATATVGVSVTLGKGDKSVDWKPEASGLQEKLDSLEAVVYDMQTEMQRIDDDVRNVEENMKDDDNDGVANYLDLEPNTPEEAIVNTHGQEIITPEVEDLMGKPETPEQGLFFTVQLGVFSTMIPEKYWRNIAPMYSLKIEDGTNRYFSGIFHSVEEAEAKLKEARDKGIIDAFITAYYKGKRITVAEAEMMLSQHGNEILREKP